MLKYGVIVIFIPFLFAHISAGMSDEGKRTSFHPQTGISDSAGGCGTQGKEKQPQFIEGEVLVKFKAGVTREEIDDICKTYGLSLMKRIGSTGVYRFKVPPTWRVKDIVDALKEDPQVEYAEPNYIVRIQR